MALFHGLFNKLYVGKAKKEITKEDMPTNPVQLFLDILKTHLFDMVKISLLMAVTCLPILVWGNINFQALLNFAEGSGDAVSYYLLIFTLGMIPCLLLSGIGLAGTCGVTCRYARDEYAWVWTDFLGGIKENWKKALLMSFLNGIVSFVCVYVLLMYSSFYSMTGNAMYYFLSYIMGIILLAFLSVNIYFWPMMTIYDMSFGRAFKYSFRLAMMKLPFTLLFGVIALLPLGLTLWIAYAYWPAAIYVGILFYAFFGFGFMQFLLSFYAFDVCKKNIQDEEAKQEEVRTKEEVPDWKHRKDPKGVWSFLDNLDEEETEDKDKK